MNNPKLSILLTFDLDGETLWTSRDKVNTIGPVMLSQGKYGPQTGVPRILELLNKHDLDATFFVTGAMIEDYPKICAQIHKQGLEIGHHNYQHEWPPKVEPGIEREEFKKGLDLVKQLTGSYPKGYRAPGWEFSDITMDLLFEAKMLYSSNMMDSETPYFHTSEKYQHKIVELPCSWVLDDAAFFMHGLTYGQPQYDPDVVKNIWIKEFDSMYREDTCRVFVLTMHPQIIGRASRVKMLDDVIMHIKDYDDVEFLSSRAMAKAFAEQNQ